MFCIQVNLHEAEMCEDHMETFFQYFYTGSMHLTTDNVLPLLLLANKYGMTSLEESCKSHACAAVFHGTSAEYILQWFTISGNLDMTGTLIH